MATASALPRSGDPAGPLHQGDPGQVDMNTEEAASRVGWRRRSARRRFCGRRRRDDHRRRLRADVDDTVEHLAGLTTAHLLAEAGRAAEAADAYRRAIELTADSAVAEYLLRRLRSVSG
jgi:hypothetical protein